VRPVAHLKYTLFISSSSIRGHSVRTWSIESLTDHLSFEELVHSPEGSRNTPARHQLPPGGLLDRRYRSNWSFASTV